MEIKNIYDKSFNKLNKGVSIKSLSLLLISVLLFIVGAFFFYGAVSAGSGAIYIGASYAPAIVSFLFYYSFKRSVEQKALLKAKQQYLKYLFTFSIDELNAALEEDLLDPFSASMAMLTIGDKYKIKNIELKKSITIE